MCAGDISGEEIVLTHGAEIQPLAGGRAFPSTASSRLISTINKNYILLHHVCITLAKRRIEHHVLPPSFRKDDDELILPQSDARWGRAGTAGAPRALPGRGCPSATLAPAGWWPEQEESHRAAPCDGVWCPPCPPTRPPGARQALSVRRSSWAAGGRPLRGVAGGPPQQALGQR